MSTSPRDYMILMARSVALLKELAEQTVPVDPQRVISLKYQASTLVDEYFATLRDTLNTEVVPHVQYFIVAANYNDADQWAAANEISKGKWLHITRQEELEFSKPHTYLVFHPSALTENSKVEEKDLQFFFGACLAGRFRKIMIPASKTGFPG